MASGGAEVPQPTAHGLVAAHIEYLVIEPRDLTYRVSSHLIAASSGAAPSFTVAEAIALLLESWNREFYRPRPELRRRLVADLETLNSDWSVPLAALRDRPLELLDSTDEEVAKQVFSAYYAQLGPVGASKALHMLAPRFFPLWDNAIRKRYQVLSDDPDGHTGQYWRFMTLTCQQVRALGGEAAGGPGILKAIDEWNFVGSPE